jgi:DNA-binding transcriptional ArsR family regulator
VSINSGTFPLSEDGLIGHGVRGAHYTGDRPTQEGLDNLYNKYSVGQIASQFNVTKTTVSRWLKVAGIKRRSNSEAGRRRFETQAEIVPLAERENCVLDRAWEARPERRIRDKVACRLCFRQVSRLTGKTAHLAVHHEGMIGAEYARLMSGHPHDCFQHSAGSNQLEIEKLMDDWCAKWATGRRDSQLASGSKTGPS